MRRSATGAYPMSSDPLDLPSVDADDDTATAALVDAFGASSVKASGTCTVVSVRTRLRYRYDHTLHTAVDGDLHTAVLPNLVRVIDSSPSDVHIVLHTFVSGDRRFAADCSTTTLMTFEVSASRPSTSSPLVAASTSSLLMPSAMPRSIMLAFRHGPPLSGTATDE